jgi:hypothetical protein
MSDLNPDLQTDFEQRSRELLQQSAEQLDGTTRSRLTQARHAALDAIKQRQRKGMGGYWLLPATGAAAAVVAVLFVQQPAPEQVAITTPTSSPVAVIDAMDIVTAEDSLEFYRDVDFYAWLDSVIDEEVAVPASEA